MSVIVSTGLSEKHSSFLSLHELCVSYWSVETDTYNAYVLFEWEPIQKDHLKEKNKQKHIPLRQQTNKYIILLLLLLPIDYTL